MTIQLRPYQSDLIARTYQSYQAGNRNVLAVLPTGGGKSVIVSQIILDGHQQGLTECVIAHRNELVGQMSLHVARRGIPHRIIASKSSVAQITAEHRREFGRSFVNPDARCSVVSVDTLIARADTLAAWAQQVNRWTIDEAHHCVGNERRERNKWGKAITMFPNAYGLGVTATPSRADGIGLGRWQSDGSDGDGPFQDMILGPSMRDLIEMGALSDYEIAVPESDFEIDDASLAPSGDWSTKRMREASKRSHIVGDVVVEYQRRAAGKRAICFATDVETAGEMAQRFNEAGITAAAVSAKTPSDVRNDMIRRFRDGRVTVLVNVDLFGEGFDVPAVEVVIMARPTASLAVYLQQFGRALRPLEGKPYGLVIDHVSNWKRHGFPDKPHIWTLDRRDKRSKREPDPDDIPLTACRSCSRPYERCLPACPYCGEAPPVPEGGARSIEQVDGDLMLLDRATLAEMRAAMQLEAPADVAARVGAVAGPVAAAGAVNKQIERHAAQERLRQAIEQWAGIRRAAGEDDRSIYKRFYLTTGVDVLSAMAGKRAEMDALANRVRSWYGAEPVETQKKTDEQLIIEAAIERGDQGFRGGWVEVGKAAELTGISPQSVEKVMKEMGYIPRGVSKRNKTHASLHSIDDNKPLSNFWVVNGYETDIETIIEAAIERGDQGFRGGWLDIGELCQRTGMNGYKISQLLDEMGYVNVGKSSMVIDGQHLRKSLYRKSDDSDLFDFWSANGYVADEETFEKAVSQNKVGFMGGWVDATEASKITGKDSLALNRFLLAKGYHLIGKTMRSVSGIKLYKTVYNIDPSVDPDDFWVANMYVEDHSVTIRHLVESEGFGFRNGWVDCSQVSELTGLVSVAVSKLLKGMGFHRIGVAVNTVDGKSLDRLVYHTDPNANLSDFWVDNPVASEDVSAVKAAVERGDQGFRGGWLCAFHITELTGAKKKRLLKIIDELGYVSLGTTRKNIDKVKKEWSVYHTDPNADPADFWEANGYA